MTAGVQVGDILVLQDGAEGSRRAFGRNRGIRIIGVTALELELAEVVNSAATVATWKILRVQHDVPVLATGYPDGGSDVQGS